MLKLITSTRNRHTMKLKTIRKLKKVSLNITVHLHFIDVLKPLSIFLL